MNNKFLKHWEQEWDRLWLPLFHAMVRHFFYSDCLTLYRADKRNTIVWC